MSNQLITGTIDDDDDDDELDEDLDEDYERIEDGAPDPEPRRGRSRKARILSAEGCLQALSAIPGLVAMGVLSTTQANSMRATYQAILQHHRQGTSPTATQLPPSLNLGQVLLDHPELATILEPLLSREQIERLMRENQHDPDD